MFVSASLDLFDVIKYLWHYCVNNDSFILSCLAITDEVTVLTALIPLKETSLVLVHKAIDHYYICRIHRDGSLLISIDPHSMYLTDVLLFTSDRLLLFTVSGRQRLVVSCGGRTLCTAPPSFVPRTTVGLTALASPLWAVITQSTLSSIGISFSSVPYSRNNFNFIVFRFLSPSRWHCNNLVENNCLKLISHFPVNTSR